MKQDGGGENTELKEGIRIRRVENGYIVDRDVNYEDKDTKVFTDVEELKKYVVSLL